MDLFKWVGRKKREEAWMNEPRRVPGFAKALPEDSGRWLVTQEFVNDEDKNLRVYMAIYQPDPKVEAWQIFHVDYNLKHDSHINANWSEKSADPMEVVKTLRDYERAYKNNPAYISHPDQRSDYRGFANKYGIHFDDDGRVFRVAAETPLVKGTFMSRESLDKLFHKEAAKSLPLDSWEGVYKGVVDAQAPEWTITEKAFGLPEAMQSVQAVPDETQAGSSPWEAPKKPALPVVSHVSQIKPGGGAYIWAGSVTTIPTAKEIEAAQTKAAADALAAKTPPAAGAGAPAVTAPGGEKPAETPPAVEPPKPVTVNGKTFEQLAAEKPWAGYKQMQQLTWQRPVTYDDVAAGKSYPEYAYYMAQMLEKLKQLPEKLTSKTSDKYQKELAVKEFARYSVAIPFRGAKKDLAKHACDATLLVGMLRAGAAVYQENFGPGKKFSPDGLQLMSTIGKICTQFAIDRLGVDAEEAKKIADVITKGADPFGPGLPLEKIFAKYPAAAFTPEPEAPTIKKAPAPKAKPKPVKKTRSWDDGW